MVAGGDLRGQGGGEERGGSKRRELVKKGSKGKRVWEEGGGSQELKRDAETKPIIIPVVMIRGITEDILQ